MKKAKESSKEEKLANLNRQVPPPVPLADRLQHYDVDGVSFSDEEGVTVASDQPKFTNIPEVDEDDAESSFYKD